MNDYKLLETSYEYPLVVCATSYINPLSSVLDIQEELIKSNFEGYVLVDRLLSNGFAKNRYIKIYFDGKKFDLKNAQIENTISDQLANVLYLFYSRNSDLIRRSNILPEAQKYLLIENLLSKNI